MSLIPRRELLPAGTALPASPAFVSAGPLDIPEGTDSITFYVTYVGGATPVFHVFYGDEFVAVLTPSEDGRDTTIDGGSFVVAAPNGTFDIWLSQPQGPSGATGLTYIVSCRAIPGGTKRVTLDIADETDTGSTIAVVVTGAGP